MPKEIERRFIIGEGQWWPVGEVLSKTHITQAYLSDNSNGLVRIRTLVNESGAYAKVTFKSGRVGNSCDEFEYDIPFFDAQAIIASFGVKVAISKVRHTLYDLGYFIEVDVFEGDNEGLVIAEIEFDSIESSEGAKVFPDWFGKEVTDDMRYANNRLSQNPYKNW